MHRMWQLRQSPGGGAKGIGGLVGSSAGNGSVNDTYASGSINSSFGSVGGLVGTTENADPKGMDQCGHCIRCQ